MFVCPLQMLHGLRSGIVLGLECQKLSRTWPQVARPYEPATCSPASCLGKVASLCRGNEKKPRRIAALKGVNIVQAACGGWHCLAVSNTGQAYAWGGNEYGQCGVAEGKRDVPQPSPCLPQHKVVQVAAGGMHTCALTDSGQARLDLQHSSHAADQFRQSCMLHLHGTSCPPSG